MKVKTLVNLKLKTLSVNADSIKEKILSRVQAAVQDAAPKLTTLIIDRISREAQNKLHTTANEYIRQIQDPENIKVTVSSVSLEPVSSFVRAIENGYDAFDIKAFALRTTDKFTKDGYPYKDISFTHQAGHVPEALKSALQKDTAKERKAGTKDPRVRFTGSLPGSTFKKTLHFGGREIETQGSNKTGLFSGVYRKSEGRAATYTTVRRISKNSAPSSWIHPGYQGAHIFKAVQESIEKDAQEILKDALHKQGIPTK